MLSIVENESTDHELILKVKGNLTIHYAESFKTVMTEHMGIDKNLTLCLDDVESVDTSGLQFLLCLAQEQQNKDKGFKLTSVNEQIEEDFILLGFDTFLT